MNEDEMKQVMLKGLRQANNDFKLATSPGMGEASQLNLIASGLVELTEAFILPLEEEEDNAAG